MVGRDAVANTHLSKRQKEVQTGEPELGTAWAPVWAPPSPGGVKHCFSLGLSFPTCETGKVN